MKMRKTTIATSIAVLALSSIAQAELSGNIGVTSNYLWRGVTQTADKAAVQGGIDYANTEGFYIGTWASNVASGEEVDLYAGFSNSTNNLGYDIGIVQYLYPSAENDDFVELYAAVDYAGLSAGMHYTVSSDKKNMAGENNTFIKGDRYYFVSTGMPLNADWSVEGTIGYYDFKNDGVAGKDTAYKHLQVGVSKETEAGAMTFALSKADKESGDKDPIVTLSWAQYF